MIVKVLFNLTSFSCLIDDSIYRYIYGNSGKYLKQGRLNMSDNTPTSGGTPLKDIILETSIYDSTEIDSKINECLKFDDNGNLDLRANTDNKTELLGFSGGNVAEGIGTQIGSKCFYIVSGDYNAKTITLEAPVDEQINQFKNK